MLHIPIVIYRASENIDIYTKKTKYVGFYCIGQSETFLSFIMKVTFQKSVYLIDYCTPIHNSVKIFVMVL